MFALLESLLLGIGLAVVLQLFLFQPFAVSGQSMQPNFYDSERLVIDKITPNFADYRRGEVVVFRKKDAAKGEAYLIKRLVGLPGERIVIRNRRISIFNHERPKGCVVDESRYHPYEARDVPIDVTLKKDEYFVLGDNRPISRDSELFGPIQRDAIVGRLALCFFPLDRLSFFGIE